MKIPSIYCLGVLVVFALLLGGCTSESSGAEGKNKTNTSAIASGIVQDLSSKKFSLGESAAADGMTITVYSVRYASVIDEKGSKLLSVSASGGKKYLIVDVSLENNNASRAQVINTMLNSEVSDSAGYRYKPTIQIMGALQKGLRDGDTIAPGAKKRGEVGYEVMEDSKDFVFSYRLDPVSPSVQYKL
jgi:hypothetical protein